ncbi:MAG: hypothetical protein ACI4BD_03155 [Paludibacteraceae bacterium]
MIETLPQRGGVDGILFYITFRGCKGTTFIRDMQALCEKRANKCEIIEKTAPSESTLPAPAQNKAKKGFYRPTADRFFPRRIDCSTSRGFFFGGAGLFLFNINFQELPIKYTKKMLVDI